MLDLSSLSDDACDNLISIFLKARPSLALELIDLAENEPDAEVSQGRFKGRIKSWWPEKGYGFLNCDQTYAVYGCDIYINRLAIGLFQKNDEVHFSVELNKEGKPQGKNLLPVTMEAKKRQLMAACDPQFDLEGYLAQHQLGPYAPGEDKKKTSRPWSMPYNGPYGAPWPPKGGKFGAKGMYPGMGVKGKGKGKEKGWDMGAW